MRVQQVRPFPDDQSLMGGAAGRLAGGLSETRTIGVNWSLTGSWLTRAHHRQGFPGYSHSLARTCRRQYPGRDERPFWFVHPWAVPVVGWLPRDFGGSASILSFSRLARRSLVRPARSPSRPTAAVLHRSASAHYVTFTNCSDRYRLERTPAGQVYPPLGWGALARASDHGVCSTPQFAKTRARIQNRDIVLS